MFKRFWWVFLVTLVLGPLAGLFTGGLIAYLSPKQYESTATLQVRPPLPSVLGSDTASPPGSSGSFFATEFEVITSQTTLDEVIGRLDLTKRWALPQSEVRQQLRELIETRQIRGTDLIEIRVRSTHRAAARLIAETLSEAYRDRKRQVENQRLDSARELRNAVRAQEDVVEEKRKALTQLIRNHDLLHWHSPPQSPARQHAQLEAQMIQLESQIDTLLRYDGEQLFTYAASLNLPENIIRTLHPQWLEAQRQLKAVKLGGLGDGHPTVRQQQQIVEAMGKDLEEGVVALRETLRAQLELVKERIVRHQIRKDREEAGEPAPKSFDELRSDFESAQSLLEQLKIRLISQEMSKRVSEDPVILHREPAEATEPVSPNVGLLLVGGTVGGLVLGLIVPFFLIPVCHWLTRSESA